MTSPRKVPRSEEPASGDAAHPWRLAALRVRGDVGGPVPHPGLSLRHDGGRRGALQGRRAGLHLLALRQSDGGDVRAADGALGGRRGGARDGERHGGGDRRADGPGRRPATMWWRAKALFGSCLYVVEELLPRFGVASTLVEGADLDAWRAAVRPNTKTAFLEIADQSDAGDRRHRRRRRDHARAGATLVVDNVFATPAAPAPAEARRGLRRLFGDQAHRRTGPGARRRHSREREIHRRQHPQFPAPDRSLSVAVQRLDASEVAGDAAGAGRGAGALGRNGSPISSAARPDVVRTLYPGRADHPQAELARRQMSGGGTMLAFEVAGGKAAAFRDGQCAVDHRHLQQSRRRQEPHHPSGDDDAPAPEARAARGARHRPGAARLSVGLEDVEDLIEDLAQALDKAAAPRRHAAE